MKKWSKEIGVVVAALCMVVLNSICVSGASARMPEKVRIGLFYSSTSVSNFSVSAVNGLQLGISKDNTFAVLCEEPENSAVGVRKDVYYTKVNNKLTEYNPSDKAASIQGEKIGPYHIKLEENFTNYDSAFKEAENLYQLGILAYPVYVDSWQVWTGFYTDRNSAQADITNHIQNAIGKGNYPVIEPSNNNIVITAGDGTVKLIYTSGTSCLQIHPKAENNPYIFKLNSSYYRGDLEIKRYTGSDMTVINIIPVEQYLYGVVPSEIESYSNAEALKAQAVAARTYTLNNLSRFTKWGFDMDTTTRCQVYKGYSGEDARTNKAVDDTKGRILTYNGKAAEVFYFAASGGKTEDVKNVWGPDVNLPYLVSVDDKYESMDLPYSVWETSVTAENIKALTKGKIGDIIGMQATKFSDSGRVIELVIAGTKGQLTYQRDECRTIFNSTKVKSQWYKINTDADIYIGGWASAPRVSQLAGKKVMTSKGLKTINSKVVIMGEDGVKKEMPASPVSYSLKGKGWGHAVGMSQEGAKGMASAGFAYDQILEHYFPGTKVQ